MSSCGYPLKLKAFTLIPSRVFVKLFLYVIRIHCSTKLSLCFFKLLSLCQEILSNKKPLVIQGLRVS